MHQLDLTTERLLLRVLAAKDAALVAAFYRKNRDHLRAWEPTRRPTFYTEPEQRRNLEAQSTEMAARRLLSWWMVRRDRSPVHETPLIGCVTLSGIMWGAFRSCFLGYKLDQQEQGNGYMTEAIKAVTRYAFETAQLHRIEANILPRNERSLAVVRRLGFQAEGLARHYLNVNGIWEDHVHMVLLNEPAPETPY